VLGLKGVLYGSSAEFADRCGHLSAWSAHTCAFRRAKSWKVAGGRPVTFSTSWLGREPLPELTVAVSQPSITA
jgi:hypothetical protein